MKDISASISDGDKAVTTSGGSGSHLWVRRVMQVTMFLAGFLVLWIFRYNDHSSSLIQFPTISHYFTTQPPPKADYVSKLESVLRNASMKDKTVIITSLNAAWAERGSMFDLFVESFRIGNETQWLLNHLVVISWDQKTHARCLTLHKHCYQLETKDGNYTDEAFFMTPKYLQMVSRKIQFLGSILEMGYNFVFTDTDIMWLRDPFKIFYKDTDFQVACDAYNGNSYDLNNFPNTGLKYVKSNNRTIWFYKFWYKSRNDYPGHHDQSVFNFIKKNPLVSEKKLNIRFLDTIYFGGFCQPSKDFNKVVTMHANCCVGIENKVNDLRILLQDWKKYMALPENEKKNSHLSWSVPQMCRTSFERAKQMKKIN